MLKTPLLIPPIVALAIAGAWLGSQHRTISTLERESAILEKAIAARTSGTPLDSPRSKPTSPAKAAKDKEPLDWKKVAHLIVEIRSGEMGDMRSRLELQQRLDLMSPEEIAAALNEIAALELSADARTILDQTLIVPLVEKDPELALTKFIDRIQENDTAMSWNLANALQKWATKDPAKASAWFDQQIAAGLFDSKSLDGRSQSRLQFEGILNRVLLGSDSDAAARRLAAMPQDQRSDILIKNSFYPFQELEDEDQLAFAKLVRDFVPERDQARTLAAQASSLVGKDGDHSKVTEFLERIKATPAERSACVKEAAVSKIEAISFQKKITRDDVDTVRVLLDAQAPETTNAVTGVILANVVERSRKIDFAEATALAVEYNTNAGNDDVLVAFLKSGAAYENKEQARILAEKISDLKRRKEILKGLK